MDEKPLYVPNNFSVRKEFWQGFGKGEAATVAVASLFFCLIAFIVHTKLGVNEAICIMAVMIGTGFAIGVVQKLGTGLSIVDFLEIQLRYGKEQQKYIYHYLEVTEKNAV